jgi:small nuclear ribonucleoprotein (snRNP)-like protein
VTNNAEKVMVILRDGRKLQGVFRSYDQYGELLFELNGSQR